LLISCIKFIKMFSKVFKTSFNQLYKNTSFVHQSLSYAPLRGISLHEYQAAQILNKFNLPVLLGRPAHSAEEAYNACVELRDEALKSGRVESPDEIDYVIMAQV